MQYVNVTVTYIQTPCLAIAFCTCTQCRQELTAVALVLFIIVARAVEEPVVILAQVGMMKLVHYAAYHWLCSGTLYTP